MKRQDQEVSVPGTAGVKAYTATALFAVHPVVRPFSLDPGNISKWDLISLRVLQMETVYLSV